ncbi:TetR/AcrR family transcriptional regulator [Hungatella effluvii]|uniref:TetR/AcrR family transcriptional regulator n=1 Tax=Hungatella effluvii TaxID=1096246 RepID=UPI0022E08CF0|nr:TetR/AcrR family transcriptional regulator [Hungatella effluvii]
MRLINEKLAADLLEAGKKEFLAHGFQGASLRDIAASLGVTTGAIYRYYTDKAELFSALVEKPARELEERYRAAQKEFADQPLQDQLTELPEVSDENSWIMEFIYDNFDAFKLIVCCSAGTGYEHYLDTLVEIEANSGRALLEHMEEAGQQIHQIDDALIHIVSSALFNGIFETVRHDMPRDKAFVYLNDLKEFYSAGWFKLLGMS